MVTPFTSEEIVKGTTLMKSEKASGHILSVMK